MDTLTEVISDLNKKGFTEDLRALNGVIHALKSKKEYSPEDLTIAESYRFEGMTDPSDEMVCFAIKNNQGPVGTLVMSFNAHHSQELETVQKIPSEK